MDYNRSYFSLQFLYNFKNLFPHRIEILQILYDVYEDYFNLSVRLYYQLILFHIATIYMVYRWYFCRGDCNYWEILSSKLLHFLILLLGCYFNLYFNKNVRLCFRLVWL